MIVSEPHGSQSPLLAGSPSKLARAALILVHGRGGSPEGMLELTRSLPGDDLAVFLPRAAGRTWYPQSFLAPVEQNEPGRTSGLEVLENAVEALNRAGVSSDRIVLAGFSQGACLTLEFAARRPRRFGAVVGLTGGLIGPADSLQGYSGSLDGTPIFLGSGDPDAHVPWSRVEETAAILEELGAEVEVRRFPGRPHTISQDELRRFSRLIDLVLGQVVARAIGRSG